MLFSAHPLRLIIRSLAKNPGFSAAAILTLALGTGACTAIFSIVDAVLLRPLPYPSADQLFLVWQKRPNGERNLASPRSYLAWNAQNHSFESLAAISPSTFNMTGNGEPQQLGGARISPDFFHTLGISPQIGRDFSPDEGKPGNTRVVILSDSLWRTLFGGEETALGRTLSLNAEPYTVIGVLPAGFEFVSKELDLWMPLTFDSTAGLNAGTLLVIGRLRKGAVRGTATRELQEIEARLALDFPAAYKGWSATLLPLQDYVAGDVPNGAVNAWGCGCVCFVDRLWKRGKSVVNPKRQPVARNGYPGGYGGGPRTRGGERDR